MPPRCSGSPSPPTRTRPRATPDDGILFGIWNVVYDTKAPPTGVVAAAVGLALLFAAGVAALERRIVRRSHRATNPRHTPLAPQVVMAATAGVYAGPVTVTVLIPAHDEEALLGRHEASTRTPEPAADRAEGALGAPR